MLFTLPLLEFSLLLQSRFKILHNKFVSYKNSQYLRNAQFFERFTRYLTVFCIVIMIVNFK